ncbi:hypothetical protein [Modestobacter roseus]|uniref:hypothetical protein n=1 Tax=Modestobacter roseus TaxID=1181884 RepID=UPI0012960D0B|nr:hypothetical protein [Modestobacter roseus]MQA35663.1 hypothetical protein [Modestobacter roseus]
MGDFWNLGTDAPWGRADWLSFGQLVFTVLGFGLAFFQLRRGAEAAEGSQQLLKNLGLRLLGNDLLVLLPQLQRVEDDIYYAVKSGDPDLVEKHLVIYARSASHVAELLRKHEGDENRALVDLLDQTIKAATRAKGELAEGASRDLREVVKLTTGRMTKASVEVSAAVARLQRKVGDE